MATYKLVNESSTASGLAIRSETGSGKSQRVVVTAHHVLDQMKGDTCVLVARTRIDEGFFERQEIRIPIRQAGKRLWNKHAKHDLAVLPLANDIRIEALPLDSLATDFEKLTSAFRPKKVFKTAEQQQMVGQPRSLKFGQLRPFPVAKRPT